MSAARIRLAAAVLTATVAVTGASALLPTAAYAAPAPVSPLTMAITGPGSNWVPIRPGSNDTEYFTVEVENTSGSAQPFTANIGGNADGALSLGAQDVSLTVAPQLQAPATGSELEGQDGELLGAFYPQGGHMGDHFTIPAHSTMAWLVSLTAHQSWPVNDSGLRLSFGGAAGSAGATLRKSIDIPVGSAHTGGPVLETLSGGSTVAPGSRWRPP
ncbi:hypothetical protein [Streptacidiphilus sp. PAMC 29251]